MYNLPYCPTHSYQILNLLQLRTDDARLICGSCHLNLAQKNKNFDACNIVDLVQAYDHPENIFQFTDAKEKLGLALFLNNQKQQMNVIKQQIEQLLNEFEQMQQEILKQTTTFLNIIKQDEFKQIFQQLANQDKSVKNEIIQEIQNKFYHYFQSIKEINQVVTQKDLQNWEQFNDKISQKYFLRVYYRFRKSGIFEEIFQSINKAELDYKKELYPCWHLLINTIQNNVNRQIKQKQLLYQSFKEGLTFPAIRRAIIGKENLLWFFISSNNQEFGAFTPFIWKEGQYSGTTEKNPSFLFSKTLNQIYPIIQSRGRCTQYFNHEFILFGGTDGGDQDLRVNPDFNSGYSRLGVGYKAPDGVDISKYSTHLFGALEPNIIQCEIYQIIFE